MGIRYWKVGETGKLFFSQQHCKNIVANNKAGTSFIRKIRIKRKTNSLKKFN